MPFTESDQLPNDPTVKIFFTGLLMLKPLADKTCQVFVHNSSSLHHLLIEVRRKRCNKPDVIMARIPGPLASIDGPPHDSHGLQILTLGVEATENAVKAYNGNTISTEGRKLSDSFTLSELLAVPAGAPNPVRSRPSILIDNGIFYTAATANINATLKKSDGTVLRELKEVPTIIGANIYLDPENEDHVVNLSWRQQGSIVNLDLVQSAETSYEIYINNEPLFEEDLPTAPRHDEFAEYFDLLPGVPENEQITLDFEDEVLPPPERGSSRSPCMSIVIDD